ncbi:MAG: hypothetical protein R2932_51180 [Caldilineaceae bacterium]
MVAPIYPISVKPYPTMKIILSRKGFDSSSGGVASPILPDGTLLSLPIPDATGPITYADLEWQGHAVGTLVESLTRKRCAATSAPIWIPIFTRRSVHDCRHGDRSLARMVRHRVT